jgi:hypothetical protein
MGIGLPTQRLYNTLIATLEGTTTLDLSVLAFNMLNAPDVSPAYVIEGLQLTLPHTIALPPATDGDGNLIQTNFLSIITLTNTGDYSIKLIHDSSLCDSANKMYFIPQTDITLQPKYSMTMFYLQVPNRTGWWEFQTQ